jgi:hypothetical protein
MYKIFLIILFVGTVVYANFQSQILPITSTIKQRMIQGNSYRRGCPVSLKNLRYLRLKYLDFRGETTV